MCSSSRASSRKKRFSPSRASSHRHYGHTATGRALRRTPVFVGVDRMGMFLLKGASPGHRRTRTVAFRSVPPRFALIVTSIGLDRFETLFSVMSSLASVDHEAAQMGCTIRCCGGNMPGLTVIAVEGTILFGEGHTVPRRVLSRSDKALSTPGAAGGEGLDLAKDGRTDGLVWSWRLVFERGAWTGAKTPVSAIGRCAPFKAFSSKPPECHPTAGPCRE